MCKVVLRLGATVPVLWSALPSLALLELMVSQHRPPTFVDVLSVSLNLDKSLCIGWTADAIGLLAHLVLVFCVTTPVS